MLRPLNSACIAALLASVLCPVAFAGKANIPDWLRNAAAQPLGAFPSETKAVILLDETDYTVTAPGEFLEHSRSAIKILRPDGREYGNPSLQYRKDEKVQFLHAWSIDAAGHEYEVKDKDFLEKGQFMGFELYSDYLEREAKAPGNEPGGIIGVEYEVKRKEWINELGWQFQYELPVIESVLTVELPAGWEYRANWAFRSPVDPTQVGSNRWQWRLKNIPGLGDEREVMMPSLVALAGRMSVAYFAPGVQAPTSASWQQVGQWYAGLVGGRPSPSPEISAKVTELIAGKPDFEARVEALTRFIQSEIRYVEISVGIGGDQPHPASEVFRSRYGDCKDKVTLLKSMLEVAGIHSYYVLIDTHRGFINPAVPSSWGNHAIIAIEIPDGVKLVDYGSVITAKMGKRYIVFDPTDQYTPVGWLRSGLQDSYALMVTDSGGELIRTPLLAPDSNVITRTGHFLLSPDGALSGEVAEERSGDFASSERRRLHERDQRERTQDFEHWLGRSLQGFSLDKIDIDQENQLQKDLMISYRVSTPLYGQTRGSLMLVRPRVLDEKSHYVEHKPRQFPLELGCPARETDSYEIEIPKEYRVDDIPDPVSMDVGFASYQSKIQVEGSKVRYWRQYLVRDVAVPREKYADWVKLQGVIGADEAAEVVLKRVQ